MSSFSREIRVDSQFFDFTFVRIYTSDGFKYFVTAVENQVGACYFTIEKNNGVWTINDAPKVPQWIHDLQDVLVKAVSENEYSG